MEVKQIGNYRQGSAWDNPQTGRVYSVEGISPTLNTCSGGGHEVKIVEPMIVASRGRNPQNPSDRTPGNHIEQRLEPNSEGICNTLTSVQKDNLVLVPFALDEQNMRIRYETFGTLTTDGSSPKHNNRVIEPAVKIKQATKEGYIECKLGGVADLSYPDSKTRRGRVQDNGDTCPTLTATETGVCRIETPYRIRKLTPRECWRIMGFSDLDFFSAMLQDKEAAIKLLVKYKDDLNGIDIMVEAEVIQKTSNTQLYKQAGNSIVKAVLMAIFKQMID